MKQVATAKLINSTSMKLYILESISNYSETPSSSLFCENFWERVNAKNKLTAI